MHAAVNTDTRPNTPQPHAWVGCLACYVAGRLVGDWFEAQRIPCMMADFESSGVDIPRKHGAERHQELWVFDYENYGGVLDRECSPTHAQRVGSLIEQATSQGIPTEALAYWLNDGHDMDDAQLLDDLEDAYCGRYDSAADYAQQLAEDIGAVPQDRSWPLYCIDWEQAWRELQYGGDNYAIGAIDGGVLIFRGR